MYLVPTKGVEIHSQSRDIYLSVGGVCNSINAQQSPRNCVHRLSNGSNIMDRA